ncbi:MAG: hypothetical protein QXZ70_09780 [Candidatus Bathyarchaeia archaeon]
MTRIFMMKLDKIQPSQLYISSEKLSEVMRKINFETPTSIEPLPIKRFGNEIVFVDGHTRAFAAFLCGFSRFRFIGKTRNSTGTRTKSASNGVKKMESGR